MQHSCDCAAQGGLCMYIVCISELPWHNLQATEVYMACVVGQKSFIGRPKTLQYVPTNGDYKVFKHTLEVGLKQGMFDKDTVESMNANRDELICRQRRYTAKITPQGVTLTFYIYPCRKGIPLGQMIAGLRPLSKDPNTGVILSDMNWTTPWTQWST